MRVEVDMPNADARAGARHVRERRLPAATARGLVEVPAAALIFRAGGAQVARGRRERQDPTSTMSRSPATTAAWWSSPPGVAPGDRLVLNISSQIAAGQKVAVNAPDAVAQPPAAVH